MKYYLCVDSGGTKVAAALYNEEFKRCGVCVTGSVRRNTTSAELVEKHKNDLIESLGLKGKTIEEFSGTLERTVLDEIKKVAVIKSTGIFGELEMGLSAAGVFGDGLLALCGTGATVFARYNGKKLAAGGYGAAVSDEGSGYYIGREAYIAAIRDGEGRGEHTVLTDMIPRHLGYDGAPHLREAIFSIYAKPDVSPVACVAKCAPVVIDAAKKNDAKAKRILQNAGRLMGEQTCYLIREYNLPDNLPIALSGSVWRGNPLFFTEFRRVVSEQSSDRKIIIPRLEPVLSGPAYNIYKNKGSFTDGDAETLLSEFPEFRYDINKTKSKGE